MKTFDELCEQISQLNRNLELFRANGDERRVKITQELIANVLKTGNQFLSK